MGKTVLTIKGEDFFINGKKVYSEIESSKPTSHGLLMNARFIQGVFDEKDDVARFNRFGKEFHPMKNTENLIKELPAWYAYGLRAFTVGFQGGGPCFTIKNDTINNSPFGEDGLELDEDYKKRMDMLIKAADEIGMVVIVSYFYPGQISRFKDGRAIANAVKVASQFLKDGNYTNVMIEICNEFNLCRDNPIVGTGEGMTQLLKIAREVSGGMLVGSSLGGGGIDKEVCEESDVILLHGNGCSRQRLYNLIKKAKEYSPNKPIVINEDSQANSQIPVCEREHVSWGNYNNDTKQEPPTDWSITKGEDLFFAYRMAEAIGIKTEPLSEEDQYYLQGLEPNKEYNGERWIRLASLYAEKINYVEFFKNGELFYTCYDDPFSVNFQWNWMYAGVKTDVSKDKWTAKVHLVDGRVLDR